MEVTLGTARLVFTPLASAQAQRESSLETVAGRVREDLCGRDRGGAPVRKLIFHVVEDPLGGGNDYVCTARQDGDEWVIVVDAVSWETLDEPLTAGPFAGKRLKMPRAASEDDE